MTCFPLQIRRLAFVLAFFGLSGCEVSSKEASSKVAAHEMVDSIELSDVPCSPSAERLCPFEYSPEEKIQRLERRREIASLPKSKEDICDLRGFQRVEFTPFEKTILSGGPSSLPSRIAHALKPPFPPIVAKGEVAEIEVGSQSFVLTKNIRVSPEDYPTWRGPPTDSYFGFYDTKEGFESMSWREFNWFGEFELDDDGRPSNPWIGKVMRAFIHLQYGMSANREAAYAHYKRTGEVIDRSAQFDFGFPEHQNQGQVRFDYSLIGNNRDLDSNLFMHMNEHQKLSEVEIFVGNDGLYLKSTRPRMVVVKLWPNRVVGEYKLCSRILERDE